MPLHRLSIAANGLTDAFGQSCGRGSPAGSRSPLGDDAAFGRRRPQSGLTFVELLVVIAIGAVLVSLALPSFASLIARKRLEGVASEFTTDLQYARSESVQRQQNIRVSSGSAGNCYVVHTFPLGSSASCGCSNTAPTCTGGAEVLKFVAVAAGTTLTQGQTVEFEPVRGMSTTTLRNFVFASSGGNWELRSELTPLGRVRTCTPNGLLAGYPSC